MLYICWRSVKHASNLRHPKWLRQRQRQRHRQRAFSVHYFMISIHIVGDVSANGVFSPVFNALFAQSAEQPVFMVCRKTAVRTRVGLFLGGGWWARQDMFRRQRRFSAGRETVCFLPWSAINSLGRRRRKSTRKDGEARAFRLICSMLNVGPSKHKRSSNRVTAEALT